MSTKTVRNENIVKLRELTEKLTIPSSNEDYGFIVKKLKDIVDNGKREMEGYSSEQSKIKCYETMCSKITTILKEVSF